MYDWNDPRAYQDPVDRASVRTDRERDSAIAAMQSAAAARAARPSATHCQECEAPIPEARRARVPGVTRCVDCENEAERRARYGR